MVETEKIQADVLSYTRDTLHLYNSSQVILHPDANAFTSQVRRYYKDFRHDTLRGFIGEDDLTIHLNQVALSGKYSPEAMQASMIAFFQPYGYFLEKTEYGRRIADERRALLSSNKTNSETLQRLSDNSVYMGGIAKFVELETGKFLQRKSGYDFDSIRSEIGRDWIDKHRTAFEITEGLVSRARTAQVPDEIIDEPLADNIIRAALYVAGISDNFDSAYLAFDNANVIGIYVQAVNIQLPKDVADAKRAIDNTLKLINSDGRWYEVRQEIDALKVSMLLAGVSGDTIKNLELLKGNGEQELDDLERMSKAPEYVSMLVQTIESIKSSWVERLEKQKKVVRYSDEL